MKRPTRVPLLSKMLAWLVLHLLVLALLFVAFVAWQLRLGLDSLLSGATGERLRSLGEVLARDLQASGEEQWRAVLTAEAQRRGVELDLWLPRAGFRHGLLAPPPDNIRRRLEQVLPPEQAPPGPANPPRFGPPPGPRRDSSGPPPPAARGPRFEGGDFEADGQLPPPGAEPGLPVPAGASGHAGGGFEAGPAAPPRPVVRPAFLARGDDPGGHYWAAVDLPLVDPLRPRPRRVILVVRSNELSGHGLFFDFQPWLCGGLAVLGLSVAFWAPFFASITRDLGHLTKAAERIAEGRFDIAIEVRRRDELGHLGRTIQSMASRLDHLVAGQKRFLGDVAHELCSPLARLRTGLGILEQRLAAAERPRLEAIESEAAELAALIEEILAFSRAAAGRPVHAKPVPLRALVTRAAARECPDLALETAIAPELEVAADERLLERAVANILRNSRRYAGPAARLRATAETTGDQRIVLCLEDDGPGVPATDPERLFEPFYRPDSARARDHGGAGLGLAIVRSCVEACRGTATARNLAPHGFRVELRLPAAAKPLEI